MRSLGGRRGPFCGAGPTTATALRLPLPSAWFEIPSPPSTPKNPSPAQIRPLPEPAQLAHWMDGSTAAQCVGDRGSGGRKTRSSARSLGLHRDRALSPARKSAVVHSDRSGSFTGGPPASTLVSSFLCSVLSGSDAPIDTRRRRRDEPPRLKAGAGPGFAGSHPAPELNGKAFLRSCPATPGRHRAESLFRNSASAPRFRSWSLPATTEQASSEWPSRARQGGRPLGTPTPFSPPCRGRSREPARLRPRLRQSVGRLPCRCNVRQRLPRPRSRPPDALSATTWTGFTRALEFHPPR